MLYFLFILFFFKFIQSKNYFNLTYQNNDIKIREKKAIVLNEHKLFKKEIIKYYISKGINPNAVKDALAYLNKKTCLTFMRSLRSDNVNLRYMHSSFYHSTLGVTPIKTQIIILGSRCPSKKNVYRFTLRKLGLDFEHNRFDRDSYVNVIHSNIRPEYKAYFIQQPYHIATTYSSKYDYLSVMHGSRREFTKNLQISLQAKEALMDAIMGTSLKPSFNDLKLLNLHYCKHKCRNKLQCINYGYPDPLNCDVCRCLPFYSGLHCEKFAPNPYPLCYKKNIFKVEKRKTPLVLTLHGDCHYFFVTKPGTRILFKTLVSKPKWYSGVGGPEEFIEIRSKNDKSVGGIQYSPYWSSINLISQSNIIILLTKYREHKYKLYLEFKRIKEFE